MYEYTPPNEHSSHWYDYLCVSERTNTCDNVVLGDNHQWTLSLFSTLANLFMRIKKSKNDSYLFGANFFKHLSVAAVIRVE